MTVHLGIDPGAVSGAWGLVDHHGAYLACGDIPHKDGRIITRQLWADLSQAIDKRDCVIWCESVFSRPGQGVASSFKFGRAAGAIEAVCERFLCPWFLITPGSWKKRVAGIVTEDSEDRGPTHLMQCMRYMVAREPTYVQVERHSPSYKAFLFVKEMEDRIKRRSGQVSGVNFGPG